MRHLLAIFALCVHGLLCASLMYIHIYVLSNYFEKYKTVCYLFWKQAGTWRPYYITVTEWL